MSLDAIKRRVQLTNRYSLKDMANEQMPLFKADVVLSIPQVMLRPSPEEIQASLNRAVQVIMKMFEGIPQWEHLTQQQKQQHKVFTCECEIPLLLLNILFMAPRIKLTVVFSLTLERFL